jgi:hypothetical protein
MADIIEGVAKRLDVFFRAAEKKQYPTQGKAQYPSAEHPKKPILRTFELCLSKLKGGELIALDSIVKNMSDAL